MNRLGAEVEPRVSLLRVFTGVILVILLSPPIFSVVLEALCQMTGAYPRRYPGGQNILPFWIYSYLGLLDPSPLAFLGAGIGWILRLRNPFVYVAGGAAFALYFALNDHKWDFKPIPDEPIFNVGLILTGAICGLIYWLVSLHLSGARP